MHAGGDHHRQVRLLWAGCLDRLHGHAGAPNAVAILGATRAGAPSASLLPASGKWISTMVKSREARADWSGPRSWLWSRCNPNRALNCEATARCQLALTS